MKILVTRPKAQAQMLAQKIAELGFTPVIFPAIEIKPLEKLPDLSNIEYLVFTSPAAADRFLAENPSINSSVVLFATGKDTALKLSQAGFNPVFYPAEAASAVSLLALKELQAVAGQKILICKGKGGNPLIAETLKERGAMVREANLYERYCPRVEQLPSLEEIDWIICTSAEALKNLIALFGEKIKNKKFVISSERLKEALIAEGIKTTPRLAKQATDEALLAVLSELR